MRVGGSGTSRCPKCGQYAVETVYDDPKNNGMDSAKCRACGFIE
jgi:predicted Zn-ribbon and HTH transcriptional regulator